MSKSEFPAAWRWLQSLTPLQRVEALSLNNEVATTVIINLVYYERKEVWNTLQIWDNPSFLSFVKEVKTNVISSSKHPGKKRPRGTSKSKEKPYKPVARSQFWQVQLSTSADPKILARNISMARSSTDSRRDELVRNRRKSVQTLCVMRSNDIVHANTSTSGIFKSSLSNYVDTVSVSYESVHNDNMAKLWSQLMTYSDGQFLQNGTAELDALPRDEFCAEWFRNLERFSFQTLVAGVLEISLLISYAKRNSTNDKSSKRLAPYSSQRLLQVEKLADFWKDLSHKERHKHFQAAYKNTNDLVTLHAKEMKKTKNVDTRKEEKEKIHQWFTSMFKRLEDSKQWDTLQYIDFFMELVSTPLEECPREAAMIECRNSILHEIEKQRSQHMMDMLFVEEKQEKQMKARGGSSKSKRKSGNGSHGGKNGNRNSGSGHNSHIDGSGGSGGGSGGSGGRGGRGGRGGSSSNTNSNKEDSKNDNNNNNNSSNSKDSKAKTKRKKKKDRQKKLKRQKAKELAKEEEKKRIHELKQQEERDEIERQDQKREIKACLNSIICNLEEVEYDEQLAMEEIEEKILEEKQEKERKERKKAKERQERQEKYERQERLRHERQEQEERNKNQQWAREQMRKEQMRRQGAPEELAQEDLRERKRRVALAKAATETEQHRRNEFARLSKVQEREERIRNAVKADALSEAERSRQIKKRGGGQSDRQAARSMQHKRELARKEFMLLRKGTKGSRDNKESKESLGGFLTKGGKEATGSPPSSALFQAGGWNLEKKEKERQQARQAQKEIKEQKERQRMVVATVRKGSRGSNNNNKKGEQSAVLAPAPPSSTLSMDNREGMYRRGVVRALAVLSSVEVLSTFVQNKQEKQAPEKAIEKVVTPPAEKVTDVTSSSASNGLDQDSNKDTTSFTGPTSPPRSPTTNNTTTTTLPTVFVYGARAMNSYLSSKEQLFTEDVDVQVYLGKNATSEDFYAWCRETCNTMTKRWEYHTINMQQQWQEHGQRLASTLSSNTNGDSSSTTTTTITSTTTNAAAAATNTTLPPPPTTTTGNTNNSSNNNGAPPTMMDMFVRREMEMTRDIAIDRGKTFRSFPWWRGALTSCSIHPPGGTQYPGDLMSGDVVMSAVSKGEDVRQYRSILQPHDVTHCKWHVLGPVVDFTWLKIKPSMQSIRLRSVAVDVPQVDRAQQIQHRVVLPMRSLRWLDRANLLTLLGASLENAWRRKKDLHRRHYLSWLQTLGLILPDVNDEGTGGAHCSGPTAMFTEFPMTVEDHNRSKGGDGEVQGKGAETFYARSLLKQQLPGMLEHAMGAVVGEVVTMNKAKEERESAQRILKLEKEVAALKEKLKAS